MTSKKKPGVSRGTTGRNMGYVLDPTPHTEDGYHKMMKDCGYRQHAVGGESQKGRKK